jgi:hypothetical protein
MGVPFQAIAAGGDLSPFDVLVVGKSALTVGGPVPAIARVRDGLRVLVFEQSAEVLEQRLGFRVQEYGLRSVFPRVPDHSLLAGVGVENLHDWHGDATLSAPRLKYELRPRYGPTVTWCGMTVPRVWRCGNKGNVASVVIEKPERGDFLPIVDGGFGLQYSPLLEYREKLGMVLFCQLDVTGRTDRDPAAEVLARNMLDYVSSWKPAARRTAAYAGNPAGLSYLKSLGIFAAHYEGGPLAADQVLVVAPGAGNLLSENSLPIAGWVKAGGSLLAIGLGAQDLGDSLLQGIRFENREHIATWFKPPASKSQFAGVGPAEVHNRDPRTLPLVAAGADILGDGVLAQAQKSNILLFQLTPWEFRGDHPNLRKTYRRASYVVSRILANMGVAGDMPIIERWQSPVTSDKEGHRWLDGFYVNHPVEWDDPYRFFRW